MSLRFTAFQKRLINVLQTNLPVCERPFGVIADELGSDEEEVLGQIRWLCQTGIVRRLGAVLNYQALGRVGTLVTAHIEPQQLKTVGGAVSGLEGVSHNYLRGNYYNLWFTLQGDSVADIEMELSKLSARFAVEFHSLPSKKVFKLDVRFDAEDDSALFSDVAPPVKAGLADLTGKERRVLEKLQNPLEITERPFSCLCEMPDGLKVVQGLINKGVIRRIAAVVNHRKLGFSVNVLFVAKVPQGRVEKAGEILARFAAVSHCYERAVFEGWGYNLFAMMHAKGMGDIQRVIDKFTAKQEIGNYELLVTEQELKKQPVKYQF